MPSVAGGALEESEVVKVLNRRTAMVAASVAVAGGAAALGLSGPLAPASLSEASLATTGQALQLSYSCGFSWWGGPRLAVSLMGDVPGSVLAGHSLSVGDVSGSATIPPSAVDKLLRAGGTLSGTVTRFSFTATGASPGRIDAAPVTFGPVRLSAGRAASVPVLSSPGSVGPLTAGSGTEVTIVPADLSIQLQVGTMQCVNTTPAGSARSSWTVAVVHPSRQQTPLPISTFGSAGAAAVAGGFLWLRLRRRRSASASVEPPRPA